MLNRASKVHKMVMKLRYAAEYDDLVPTDKHKLMLDAANLLEELEDYCINVSDELSAFLRQGNEGRS